MARDEQQILRDLLANNALAIVQQQALIEKLQEELAALKGPVEVPEPTKKDKSA
jgi:hypothetical protein